MWQDCCRPLAELFSVRIDSMFDEENETEQCRNSHSSSRTYATAHARLLLSHCDYDHVYTCVLSITGCG